MSNDKAAATYHPRSPRKRAHDAVADPVLRPDTVVDLVRWEFGPDGWVWFTVRGRYVGRSRHNWRIRLADNTVRRYPRKDWAVSLPS